MFLVISALVLLVIKILLLKKLFLFVVGRVQRSDTFNATICPFCSGYHQFSSPLPLLHFPLDVVTGAQAYSNLFPFRFREIGTRIPENRRTFPVLSPLSPRLCNNYANLQFFSWIPNESGSKLFPGRSGRLPHIQKASHRMENFSRDCGFIRIIACPISIKQAPDTTKILRTAVYWSIRISILFSRERKTDADGYMADRDFSSRLLSPVQSTANRRLEYLRLLRFYCP